MLPFCRHGYQLQGPLPSHARGRDAEGQARGILETAGRDLPIVVAIASPSSRCCRSATNSPSAQPLPARTLCHAIAAGSARARAERLALLASGIVRGGAASMLARACLELGMIFHCLCGVCVHAGKPACVDRGRHHLHSTASLFCSQVASPALHNSIGSLLACHRPLPLVSRRGQKGYPLPSCSGRRRGPLPREHGRRSLVCAPSASCGLCLQVLCRPARSRVVLHISRQRRRPRPVAH